MNDYRIFWLATLLSSLFWCLNLSRVSNTVCTILCYISWSDNVLFFSWAWKIKIFFRACFGTLIKIFSLQLFSSYIVSRNCNTVSMRVPHHFLLIRWKWEYSSPIEGDFLFSIANKWGFRASHLPLECRAKLKSIQHTVSFNATTTVTRDNPTSVELQNAIWLRYMHNNLDTLKV